MTTKEGRVYRLPTSIEFEVTGKNYPWGDDDPEKQANFDAEGTRRFDRWADYLRPARGGEKNGYGLYGMAGNVWQISVVTAIHPISSRYVTATASLDYRLWLARNIGGGYRSIYDRPLKLACAD
jgi:hypothetical protein